MKVSEKVLVAETKDIDAAHLRLMLERSGCETEIVKSSFDLLNRLEHNQYLFIVMNEKLQDIDGAETVEMIRQIEENSENNVRVPILGLTSYSLPAEKKKFQKSGIDYCLSKPVYKNKLNKVLAEILEKKHENVSPSTDSKS